MRIDSSGNPISAPSQPQMTDAPAPIKKAVKVDMPIKMNHERVAVEGEISAEQKNLEQEHQVIKAIEKANKHIKTFDRRLEFSIHDTTKQIMVKVINTEDDSIIREIPSEKVLDMVAHLWEMAGILVDEHR